MAVTHASGLRDDIADLVGAAHADGSSGQATLELRDGSSVVVAFQIGNTPFNSASSGTITLQGVPINATATGDGDVDNFQTKDRDGNVVLSGSVTAIGMGGDIEVTNTNVANGQDCSLESLTYSAPA